eukprot:4202392-Amphidinium_carterae.3
MSPNRSGTALMQLINWSLKRFQSPTAPAQAFGSVNTRVSTKHVGHYAAPSIFRPRSFATM